MTPPGAIIFVNNDLTASARTHLVKQLQISEVIDGYTFDQRIVATPTYVEDTRRSNLRVLVERPYTEAENRDQADVVIFVSHGMAAILQNNFGPPTGTHRVLNLHWGQLL